MADQDFNIKIVTTADTAGIAQTEAALNRLSHGGFAQPLLAPVPPELTSDLAANGEKIASSMEEAGGASLFLGANLTRARQESIILARELATGVPTVRTFSSLLGSMGLGIAGAALAGYGLHKAIAAYGEEQLRVNREIDAQLTKLTELSHKWSEVAKAATSPEDVQKVAQAVLPTIEEAQSKFTAFQNQGTSWLKDMLDSLVKIPGIAGGPFEEFWKKEINRRAEAIEETRKDAGHAIKLGEEYEKAFDKRKVEPLSQSIRELTKLITDQEILQKRIGPENAESYAAVGRTIQNYKNQLIDIIKLQKEAQASADAAAKPLAAALLTPTDKFIEDQKSEAIKHDAQRAALEQKRREAIATGDTERAKAIDEELQHDAFARDQRKEGLQRFIANQESISGGPGAAQVDRMRELGTQGFRRFEDAQAELSSIYARQKADQPSIGREGNAQIIAWLQKLYQLWQ